MLFGARKFLYICPSCVYTFSQPIVALCVGCGDDTTWNTLLARRLFHAEMRDDIQLLSKGKHMTNNP